MKNLYKLVGIAVLITAIVFSITGCPEDKDDTPPVIPPTPVGIPINSALELKTFLEEQDHNTANNPIYIDLNISSLGGNSTATGSIGNILRSNETKFVSLDFSGSSEYFTEVAANAFSDCKNLTRVVLGDSVETIGANAFSGCTNLTSVTIGNNVQTITPNIFSGCTNLANVTIGNGVETIEANLFSGFTKLTSITLGNNVQTIGANAFANTKITSITLPSTLTTINNNAFLNCTEFTGSIIIPDSVTSIGSGVFSGTNLTSITTGNGITSITNNTFSGCAELAIITIGSNVITIETSAFNLTKLTNINVNTDNLTYSSSDGILYNKNQTTIIRYPMGKEWNNFTIPNTVTTIGAYAFDGIKISSIAIPNTITTIQSNAFNNTNLSSVTLPYTVTTIGSSTFLSVSSVTLQAFNNNFTSAFRQGQDLATVYNGYTIPPASPGAPATTIAGGPGTYSYQPNKYNNYYWRKM